MKQLLLLAGFSLLVSTAYSQKTLRGRVVDASTNVPLPGATVSFAARGGTITDRQGIFRIDCETVKRITISHIGYEPYSTNIKSCDELTIGLIPVSRTMNDVEITATSSQNRSLLYQPVSITKLTPLELKRGQGVFLDDAIQTSVPGVIMNRRTVSGGQQFNIRGYGNGTRGTRGISSNFDGQGYKVYLNGIPVTDAEGITTLDDIDYASIGNVEIVKGPAGTLYGQAIAGAINFKTITPPKGRTSIAQDIMVGNYGLQRYTTHFDNGGERSSILLNYGKQKSDGFSIHNKSNKDFVNFAGDFQPNDKQLISSYFGYSDSYDERFGELTIAQYETKDYSGNVDYIKRNGHSHVVTFRTGVNHTYDFSARFANTTTIFGAGFRSDVSSAAGWTDKTAINYGFRTSFDTKFPVGEGIALNGITGMEIQRQDAQTVGYNMKQNPADTTTTPWVIGKPYWVVNATTSNVAFVTMPMAWFTEWTLALPHDLSLTAGVGISTQKITLDDRLNAATATKPSHFDTTYKKMISPHFAVNKVFSKQASAYVSYSTGYKAPASSYFFITTPAVTTPATPATGRLNEVLKPEKGEQFEVGTKGAILNDRFIYQLAFFVTKFSNKMTSVAAQLNTTTTAYSYVVNGGDQRDKGIEASVKYSFATNENGLFTNITPFVNFTYSDFRYGTPFVFKTGTTTSNITTIDYSGLDVFGVPKVMSAEGIDVAMRNGLYASLSHLYRDGVNIGYENDVLKKSRSYNLLNGKLGYKRQLSKHFDLDAFFGVNNITGAQYPIMIFVNQIPDAYLPAPLNAVVFGGVNLKYNF